MLFNPSKQVAYTRDLARAFRGNAPSLSLIEKAFGSCARDTWLDIQLTELAAFSGCKDKLTDHQVECDSMTNAEKQRIRSFQNGAAML